MRVRDENKQFYRVSEEAKSRVWLNLTNDAGIFSQALVGYISEATNGVERGFDGEVFDFNSARLYSVVDSKKLTIQGRALPFEETDVVPLGVKILTSGSYQIAIGNTDGLFNKESSEVYIEDKTLGLIHDLRVAPYSFNSVAGTFDERFVLRYTAGALGLPTNVVLEKNVKVAVDKGLISVVSSSEDISSIFVFDMLGRQIGNQQNINSKSTSIYSIAKDQSVIIKIVLISGETVSRKLVL